MCYVSKNSKFHNIDIKMNNKGGFYDKHLRALFINGMR